MRKMGCSRIPVELLESEDFQDCMLETVGLSLGYHSMMFALSTIDNE